MMIASAKRFACSLTAALFLFTLIPIQARAVGTSATAAILVDETSGQVLYEKNADQKMRIASTTKIMTALVAIRDGNLSDVVTVSRHAASVEGSSMYLKSGEELTLETLLYGLLLSSGNDAATAIAEHIAGSEAAFAERMNETARDLGMTNSSFANPHGLDAEGHYSTARDMAALGNAAMEMPVFRRIASTRSITIGSRTLTNHNKLLGTLEGCVGLKTGYTRAAGRTLVTCVERDGRRLIAVTLQDGNDWEDHRSLYEYGFAQPAAPPVQLDGWPRQTASAGTYLGETPVLGGMWPSVPLMAEGEAWCTVPEGAEISIRIDVSGGALRAPLRAGQKAGEAVFLCQGREVGRVGAICAVTIPAEDGTLPAA